MNRYAQEIARKTHACDFFVDKNARVRYNVIIEVKYGKYWIPRRSVE